MATYVSIVKPTGDFDANCIHELCEFVFAHQTTTDVVSLGHFHFQPDVLARGSAPVIGSWWAKHAASELPNNDYSKPCGLNQMKLLSRHMELWK